MFKDKLNKILNNISHRFSFIFLSCCGWFWVFNFCLIGISSGLFDVIKSGYIGSSLPLIFFIIFFFIQLTIFIVIYILIFLLENLFNKNKLHLKILDNKLVSFFLTLGFLFVIIPFVLLSIFLIPLFWEDLLLSHKLIPIVYYLFLTSILFVLLFALKK